MNLDTTIDSLKFPIGKFVFPMSYSSDYIEAWIRVIEGLPERLTQLVMGLNEAQLDTPYRPDGWTVRQVVHHLADSHMNSYFRFKLALTEETPTIRPYFEERWAELYDGKNAPVELSLQLIEALHKRWVYFLRKMSAEDWERRFFHPESKKEFTLKSILALYAWHSEHHFQHILQLKVRMNWNETF